jgi:ATP-binding cassette subfamily C protein CydCD
MRPLDPRLLRHARVTRAFLVASVAMGGLSALLVVAQAFLIADAVVAVFQDGASAADLTGTLMALVVITAARALLAWAAEAVGHRSAAAAISELRLQVMGRALRSGSDLPVAELATLVSRGADALDGYFARYLPQLVLAVLVPLIAGTAILTQDPLAAVIIALTVPLIPVFMILIGRYTQGRVDRQWHTLGVLSGYFLDLVAGLPTLKIFNRARAQAQNLRTIGERYRAATMSVLRVSFLSSLVLELLATLSVAIIAVAIGLRLVEGTLDLTTGLTVLVLAPEVYLPLRMVGVHFHAAADGVAAAERMFDLIESPSAVRGTAQVSARTAALRITDLRVRYADRIALDGLTTTIRPGRITALTGPSGCGKSTVLRVLLDETRAADVSGSVELVDRDGAATSLSDLDLGAWRAQLGWVPQRPSLLPGTVADNVRFGRDGYPDPVVEVALRDAGLPPESLPAGLDTLVTESGGVSGGEARRIGLARALLGQPAILLLDEPSASVDASTEADVVATLRRLRDTGTTVVVVTHRTAVIEAADNVAVLTLPIASAVVV